MWSGFLMDIEFYVLWHIFVSATSVNRARCVRKLLLQYDKAVQTAYENYRIVLIYFFTFRHNRISVVFCCWSAGECDFIVLERNVSEIDSPRLIFRFIPVSPIFEQLILCSNIRCLTVILQRLVVFFLTVVYVFSELFSVLVFWI